MQGRTRRKARIPSSRQQRRHPRTQNNPGIRHILRPRKNPRRQQRVASRKSRPIIPKLQVRGARRRQNFSAQHGQAVHHSQRLTAQN